MRADIFALATACLMALAPIAAAQTTTAESTPVVIHAGAAGGEGVIDARAQIVLRQGVTTVRAAVLDEPAARPSGNGRQREGFPAGERLFGIYDGDESWSYCALRESFWLGDALTCYQDTNEDGRLDVAMPSGAPFLGVPFFILAQTAEQRPLAMPAAFRRIPYDQGPSIEAGLRLTLTEARVRRSRTEPATALLEFGYILDNDRFVPVRGTSHRQTLEGAGPVTLSVADAHVELTGQPVRGQLHYRVVEAMPAHIDRVIMTQTVTYTTTYVPIYVPR